MNRPPIDLRSDTVTKPTPAMRRAMAEAEVGDDVYGEDPTVKRLEQRCAKLLGKEAALFVPSGTMANQIAIGVHCAPGDELVCGETAHVYVWEGGGIARLWGATARPLAGDLGMISAGDLAGKVRPDDGHYVRTRLVCLENTHNRAGGRVQPIDDVAAIAEWARANGLAMHLDGARLMNAVVASGVSAEAWASHFDTVSVCLSKGLGAPVGSIVAGTAAMMKAAHRLRKVLGGGMRQAGILAAAAIHALDHHVDRLAEDHANAKILADAVQEVEGLSLESGPVETNLVWVRVDPAFATAGDLASRLKTAGRADQRAGSAGAPRLHASGRVARGLPRGGGRDPQPHPRLRIPRLRPKLREVPAGHGGGLVGLNRGDATPRHEHRHHQAIGVVAVLRADDHVVLPTRRVAARPARFETNREPVGRLVVRDPREVDFSQGLDAGILVGRRGSGRWA